MTQCFLTRYVRVCASMHGWMSALRHLPASDRSRAPQTPMRRWTPSVSPNARGCRAGAEPWVSRRPLSRRSDPGNLDPWRPTSTVSSNGWGQVGEPVGLVGHADGPTARSSAPPCGAPGSEARPQPLDGAAVAGRGRGGHRGVLGQARAGVPCDGSSRSDARRHRQRLVPQCRWDHDMSTEDAAGAPRQRLARRFACSGQRGAHHVPDHWGAVQLRPDIGKALGGQRLVPCLFRPTHGRVDGTCACRWR